MGDLERGKRNLALKNMSKIAVALGMEGQPANPGDGGGTQESVAPIAQT
jgi:hypothetical protein